jgi:tetratricopeptide (TPR) repeat protein
LFSYGLTQVTKGNYALAKNYYDRAERIYPDYPTLEINMGILAGAMSNPITAEKHFKHALEISDDADGHYYYGRWLVSAGRAPDAISQLTAASRIDGARSEPRALLMKLSAAAANRAEVERLAREALSYNPGDRDAALALAGSVASCGSYQQCFDRGLPEIGSRQFLDAALLNREATHYDPNAADAWINLGWSLAQLGLDDAARTAFQRVIELRPNHERARNNLEWLQNGKMPVQ